MTVDDQEGQIGLAKQVDGVVDSAGWVPTPVVNTHGGANRIVIRCFKEQILVYVNGEEVFEVYDDSFRSGRIGIGAISWSEPAVVNFDNLIATTPTEG